MSVIRPVEWRDDWTERFDLRIERREDHWLWTGYVDPKDGYGRFKPAHDVPSMLAHRLAYARWVGPIPDDAPIIDHVKHAWRHKRCVRPDHLEAITFEENIRRGESQAGKNARLTHCPRCGDPLEPPYCTLLKDGSRRCLRCQRAEHARYRARKRKAALAAQALLASTRPDASLSQG